MLEWLLEYNATHPMPAEMPSLFSIAVVCLIVGGIAGFVVWLITMIVLRGVRFGDDVAFVFGLGTLAAVTLTAFSIAVG